MDLMAEVALELSIGAGVVLLHHHFFDVSDTRALATWQDARIGVDLVASGELAHYNLFKHAHCFDEVKSSIFKQI